MEVSAALRRIKRQFGDEYNVVINDQDIYDWIHDAELDIIRSTSDNDLTIPVPCARFPVQIPDKVNVKRLSIKGKALTNVSLSQLDLTGTHDTSKGGISYWYYQGGQVYLWPGPETTDTSIIDVTYARTPTQMTVVAPFLQFDLSDTVIQSGAVPSDLDWHDSQSVNIAVTMALDSLTRNFIIVNCGDDTTVALNHFSLWYNPPGSFLFSVSDGATASAHVLALLELPIVGEVFKIRVSYDNTTDTARLYKVNIDTGVEILQDTHTTGAMHNKQSVAPAPICIGSVNPTSAPSNTPTMRVYGIDMKRGFVPTSPTVFLFDGLADLGNQFGPSSSFVTSSGHTMTTTGGIVANAVNTFTVPEVFHEDVVKFCLARAHTKNQNFKAAESEMEQYDRRVSTRRNESQSAETTLYKIADPFDYSDYVGY